MQYSIKISAIGCYNNVIKNSEMGFYGNREEDQSDPTEIVDESDRICFAFGGKFCHGQPLGERKDRAELPRPAQAGRNLQREGCLPPPILNKKVSSNESKNVSPCAMNSNIKE